MLVGMTKRGAAEFARYLESKEPWHADVYLKKMLETHGVVSKSSHQRLFCMAFNWELDSAQIRLRSQRWRATFEMGKPTRSVWNKAPF